MGVNLVLWRKISPKNEKYGGMQVDFIASCLVTKYYVMTSHKNQKGTTKIYILILLSFVKMY